MVDWKFWRIRIRNLELFTFFILFAIYTLAIIIEPDTLIYNWVASLSKTWHDMATGAKNAYIVAFLIALGGNSTVLIVVPYALVIFDLSIKNPSVWFWIAILAGIGAALGEIVSYYVGRLVARSKSIKETEIGEKFHRMKLQFEKNPRTVPWFVFFFALTPLPDDVILVPLGMMGYNYKKTIIPCAIGKTILCGIICYLGSLIGTYQDFLDLLIEEVPIAKVLRLFIRSQTVNPSSDLVTFSFVFIFIYIIIRLDFETISKKRSKSRKQFQKMLKDGGNFELDQLIIHFDVINSEKFTLFMIKFAEKHPNISKMNGMLHFDSISDDHLAYVQSMEFIEYFYETESDGNITEELVDNKEKNGTEVDLENDSD